MHLRYIALTNGAISARPEGMAVTTHLCRGNFQSSWVASGGYDFVAEALFNELDVDGFFLEYDDERSGGFEPLRFVPKGKQVVLGLVTTKRPRTRVQGRPEAPDRGRGHVRAARPDLPVGPVRLRLHRRGQRPHRRRPEGQARADRLGGATRSGASRPACHCEPVRASDGAIAPSPPQPCPDRCQPGFVRTHKAWSAAEGGGYNTSAIRHTADIAPCGRIGRVRVSKTNLWTSDSEIVTHQRTINHE